MAYATEEFEVLAKSRNKSVFLQRREGQEPAVLKVLHADIPERDSIQRLDHELEVTRDLDLPGVRRAIQRLRVDNREALELEYVAGTPLQDWLQESAHDLNSRLRIALALAEVLSGLHEKDWVHKDLNTQNILVLPDDSGVCLIDFGIAGRSQNQIRKPHHNDRLEGSPHYISPEQTGRITRSVDTRSDLYSLGVILFEMFTGRLPFDYEDTFRLVHAHISKPPPQPAELSPELPPVLARIILRLMAKNAEERYQSAAGLASDLRKCLQASEQGGRIEDFALGEADYAPTFYIPEKRYGHDAESQAIREAFARCREGGSEVIWIAGAEGMGKSSLVLDQQAWLVQRNAIFASGRFDPFQTNIPYLGITQAFGDFGAWLLTLDEQSLENWKARINEAVGDMGQVLVQLLPHLDWIIDLGKDLPQLDPAEAQNRFRYVMRRFVQAISSREHPLVLHLDDLQWADASSILLLQSLVMTGDLQHFLLVGTFREKELAPDHPLSALLNHPPKGSLRMQRLQTAPLTAEQCRQMLADTLGRNDEETGALSALIWNKSQGHPHFVRDMLQSLYNEGLFQFRRDENRWTWDLEAVKRSGISENMAELIEGKVKKLPEGTRELLFLASCWGESFSLGELAGYLDRTPRQLRDAFRPALDAEVLGEYGGRLWFAHERVRETAYRLADENSRSEHHARIAQHLMSLGMPAERLFEIAGHLSAGRAHIGADLRPEALDCLRKAANKALESVAFGMAADAAETGLHLLGADAVKAHYGQWLELMNVRIESAFLAKDMPRLKALSAEVMNKARHNLDTATAVHALVMGQVGQGELQGALESGLGWLEKAGHRFPAKPGNMHLLRGLLATNFRLRGKTQAHLVGLPVMEDPNAAAAMRIFSRLISAAYLSRPKLLPLLIFRQISLTLKKGLAPESSSAFDGMGAISVALGQFEKGNFYSSVSTGIIERLDARKMRCQNLYGSNTLVEIWVRPYRDSIQPLQQAFEWGLESGDWENACMAQNARAGFQFQAGIPLGKLRDELLQIHGQLEQLNQPGPLQLFQLVIQLTEDGHVPAERPAMEGQWVPEPPGHTLPEDMADKTYSCIYHTFRLMAAYHLGRYEEAMQSGVAAAPLLESVIATIIQPFFYTYYALTALALPAAKRPAGYKRLIRKGHKALRRWHKYCAANQGAAISLVEAEMVRDRGDFRKALSLLEKAQNLARNEGFLKDEMLAFQLAGQIYLEQQNRTLAELYLQKALQTAIQWEAYAFAESIRTRFAGRIPGLHEVLDKVHPQGGLAQSGRTLSMDQGPLDLHSILMASTALSGEIKTESLLPRLMEIVMENAGAQRGLLLLEREGTLRPRALARWEGEMMTELLDGAEVQGDLMPHALLRYVSRSLNPLILSDALADDRFGQDPYVMEHAVRSVLCLPVMHQSDLRGLIYLENNLAAGVFATRHLQVLELLSGQIAISLENAALVSNLEEKVAERTRHIRQEQMKSEQLLLNILPRETARDLKQYGHSKPQSYESVSIMFTDFKEFTQVAEQMDPSELVDILSEYFSEFDRIVELHGLEKIKTIGDAYMCAGGLPVPNESHARDTVAAALDILRFTDQFRQRRLAEGKPSFEIRIGIHSGPVVAGVVGKKKFAYDIWGDSVNTAARMESAGEPGRINISEQTYELVNAAFACTFRGRIEAKHKGKVGMYFVDGPAEG